jgi:hypothetical protein
MSRRNKDLAAGFVVHTSGRVVSGWMYDPCWQKHDHKEPRQRNASGRPKSRIITASKKRTSERQHNGATSPTKLNDPRNGEVGQSQPHGFGGAAGGSRVNAACHQIEKVAGVAEGGMSAHI